MNDWDGSEGEFIFLKLLNGFDDVMNIAMLDKVDSVVGKHIGVSIVDEGQIGEINADVRDGRGHGFGEQGTVALERALHGHDLFQAGQQRHGVLG